MQIKTEKRILLFAGMPAAFSLWLVFAIDYWNNGGFYTYLHPDNV